MCVKEEPPEEQQKFINVTADDQHGHTEDQPCIVDPSKNDPCSPEDTDNPTINIGMWNLKLQYFCQSIYYHLPMCNLV